MQRCRECEHATNRERMQNLVCFVYLEIQIVDSSPKVIFGMAISKPKPATERKSASLLTV